MMKLLRNILIFIICAFVLYGCILIMGRQNTVDSKRQYPDVGVDFDIGNKNEKDSIK